MRNRLHPLIVALAAIVLVTWSSFATAKTVEVTLTTGRTIVGELVKETGDTVEVIVSNIPTKISRDDIREMKVRRTIDDEYKEKLAAVDAKDVKARFTIATWLYDNKAYPLAKTELEQILKLEPDNKNAQILLRATNQWIESLNKKPPVDPPKDDGTGTKVTVTPPFKGPTNRLSEADVNWIRLYEYDFADRLKPRVEVTNDTINLMYEKYANDARVPKGQSARSAFLRRSGFEKLELLFQVSERDVWGQAVVRGDPLAMRTWRTKIHNNYVLNYCATAQCHGGPNSGKLYLFRDDTNSDETVYTNFFILATYKNDVGYMIDRDAPEQSLLIQYGLPHDRAQIKHPDMGGWKANSALGRGGDRTPMMQSLLDWISRELYKPAPRYEEVIQYKAPTAGGAPAATTPAAPDSADAPSKAAPAPANGAKAAPAAGAKAAPAAGATTTPAKGN